MVQGATLTVGAAMFELELERYGQITVAHFKGDMVLETAVQLRSRLEEALKTPKVKDVALDLTTVGNIDSTGLGALVGASTSARAMGKRLMLYRPAPNVLDMLERSEISGFFPLLDDEDELRARLPGSI